MRKPRPDALYIIDQNLRHQIDLSVLGTDALCETRTERSQIDSVRRFRKLPEAEPVTPGQESIAIRTGSNRQIHNVFRGQTESKTMAQFQRLVDKRYANSQTSQAHRQLVQNVKVGSGIRSGL